MFQTRESVPSDTFSTTTRKYAVIATSLSPTNTEINTENRDLFTQSKNNFECTTVINSLFYLFFKIFLSVDLYFEKSIKISEVNSSRFIYRLFNEERWPQFTEISKHRCQLFSIHAMCCK